MEINEKTYRLTDSGRFGKVALIIGIAGLILTSIGFFGDEELRKQMYFSYLTSFFYWLTIVLGAMFFILLHHLTNATWSVVIRRLVECIMVTIPLMAVLFIPILFGMHDLYHWTHEDIVASDAILQGKSAYLNVTFFNIRAVFYFVIWGYIAGKLYKTSLNQDLGFQESQVVTMRRVSAPGMILFALTLSFASYDWLMSLNPHWFSTIFGVYIFAGSTLAILAFVTVLSMYLSDKGVFKNIVTIEHFHDLGRLMLTFTIFWAYIAFSQYFLIWYANIPEESIWFLDRWVGSWKIVSVFIAFAFTIPFLTMMFRASKRSHLVLVVTSVYLLIFHWVDMYWLVSPNLHESGVVLSWFDLTAFLGIGGLFFWFFWRKFSANAIVPVGEPRLQESINIVH